MQNGERISDWESSGRQEFRVCCTNREFVQVPALQKESIFLSKQLLRSGTSIGANVHEGRRAQSRADFLAKMSIALKESNETYYWLKLLYRTEYLSREEYLSMYADIDEILRILTAICKTTAGDKK